MCKIKILSVYFLNQICLLYFTVTLFFPKYLFTREKVYVFILYLLTSIRRNPSEPKTVDVRLLELCETV